MDIYLPIAGISVNIFLLLGLGGVVGFLSGLLGVGGGFLLTPLMMMIGIPPAVAAASGSNQTVATASSGAFAHWRQGTVDFRMGLVLLAGGLAGGTVGVQLVSLLRRLGDFAFAMKLIYVVVLGGVGLAMLVESLGALAGRRGQGRRDADDGAPRQPVCGRWCQKLPLRMHFPRSNLTVSAIFPLGVGAAVGVLTALLGVGGGFVMVPIMIYVIRMPTVAAIGTDLFQIVLTSANVTIQQAVFNHSVDVLLALILLAGSTVGAQIGALASRRLRGEHIRLLLALLVLATMIKLGLELVRPPADLVSLAVSEAGGH